MTEKNEPLNRGDWIHIAELVILVFGMGVAWGQLSAAVKLGVENHQHLDRIEHYLSSKDPSYWRIVAGNELPTAERTSE